MNCKCFYQPPPPPPSQTGWFSKFFILANQDPLGLTLSESHCTKLERAAIRHIKSLGSVVKSKMDLMSDHVIKTDNRINSEQGL